MFDIKIEKNNLIYIGLAAVFILFLIYFFSELNNTPVVDDFWYLNEFCVLHKSVPFIEKLKPFLVIRNSHRCVTTFVFGYILNFVFGHVTPIHMMYIGLLSYFGVFIVILKTLKNLDKKYYLILFLIAFNPTSYSLIFWPYVAISVFFTVFLSFLLLYLISYHPDTKKIYLIILALTITFSNGNGMIIWLAGGILLGINKNYSTKFLAFWIFVALAAISIYFINAPHSNLPIVFNTQYFLKVIVFCITFLGNGFDFFPSTKLSNFNNLDFIQKGLFALRIMMVAGLPMVFCVKLFTRVLKIYKNNLAISSRLQFIIGAFVFLGISGAMAAILRADQGFGMGMAYRYKFYGQIIVALLFLLSVEDSKRTIKFWMAFAILYFLGSYIVFYPYSRNFNLDNKVVNLDILVQHPSYLYKAYGSETSQTINAIIIPNLIKYKVFDFKDEQLQPVSKHLNELIEREEFAPKPNIAMKIDSQNIVLGHWWGGYFNDAMLILQNQSTHKTIYLPLYHPPIFNWNNFSINTSRNALLVPLAIPDGVYAILATDLEAKNAPIINTKYRLIKEKSAFKINQILTN